MNTKNKTRKTRNVRISEKAYQKIKRQAQKGRQTFVTAADVIVGV